MKAIEIKRLTKYYGKVRGIQELMLDVEEGDFFGFIGPNGAGKSTTIRSLLGLITPTEGEAKVLGIPCARSRTQILQNVGYMPSEAFFYEHMRVKEVIRLAAQLHGKDCKKEAEQLCLRLKLDVDKRLDELSLGNRKKVSIVCALQHKPRLYILDEPTSGLDPLIQQEFFSLLKERNRQGATVFLSSHVLGEIQKHCRHAAIIKEGRLIRQGSVEELAHSSVKKVTVTVNGRRSVFWHQGSVGELLKRLQELEQKEGTLCELTVMEPTLDEVVLNYYS